MKLTPGGLSNYQKMFLLAKKIGFDGKTFQIGRLSGEIQHFEVQKWAKSWGGAGGPGFWVRSMIFVISRKSSFLLFLGVESNFWKKKIRTNFYYKKFFSENFSDSPKNFFFPNFSKIWKSQKWPFRGAEGSKIHDFAHFWTWKCCISPLRRPIWDFLDTFSTRFATGNTLKQSELKSDAFLVILIFLLFFCDFFWFFWSRHEKILWKSG